MKLVIHEIERIDDEVWDCIRSEKSILDALNGCDAIIKFETRGIGLIEINADIITKLVIYLNDNKTEYKPLDTLRAFEFVLNFNKNLDPSGNSKYYIYYEDRSKK